MLVARTAGPSADAVAMPGRPDEWDHAHLVLVAWKARSLLTEATGLVQRALASTACTDEDLVDELRAAVEATEATVVRLRAAALAHVQSQAAEGPDGHAA